MKQLAQILILLHLSYSSYAIEIDEELAGSLKIEANHNYLRLKSFKTEDVNNKIIDSERERGLGEFLEEQEKWDLLRDRGLREYRAQKRKDSTREGSSDYFEYLEQKESDEARYERSRKIHVQTREQILNEFRQDISKVEATELGLDNARPRFDLRKRSLNKWASGETRARVGGGSTLSSPAVNDFPPAPDFPTAPAPYESDESLIPPPPPIYDSNSGVPYDGSMGTGTGGEIIIPPPPPPPDFDF